jgi:membrane protease subunit HflK
MNSKDPREEFEADSLKKNSTNSAQTESFFRYNLARNAVKMIAGAVVLIYLLSGFYVLQPDEQGVVTRFGRISANKVQPGIHYRLPWPVESLAKVKVKEIKRMSVGFKMVDQILGRTTRPEEMQYLTGDENIINIQMMIQYVIQDPAKFLFHIHEPQWLVRKSAEANLTVLIGSMLVDDVLTTGKLAIQEKLKKMVQRDLDLYDTGFVITGATFQEVSPPLEVASVFKEVASAREDRSRIINEAMGYYNNTVPQARGVGEKVVREAEAYREEKINHARGEANKFLSQLEEYRKAKNVTMTRLYLETMEEILPKVKKYMVEKNAERNILDLRFTQPQ